jgi:hypothetical protein
VSTLVEFLRARLDEDEEAARNATEGAWFADHPEPKHWGDDPESALIVRGKVLCILDNQHNGPLNADHIVRHAPTRVLSEVGAKRQILAYAMRRVSCGEAHPQQDMYHPNGHADMMLLRLLAMPYSGHPDYREEWKP